MFRLVASLCLVIAVLALPVGATADLDDTHTRIFTVMRLPKGGVTLPPVGEAKMYAGKSWFELDEEGHQRYPGDYEAQVGQGAITFHSEEHLASSDRGVSVFRKQYREAIRTVMEDGDPINAAHPREDALITLRAGNSLIPAAAVAAD